MTESAVSKVVQLVLDGGELTPHAAINLFQAQGADLECLLRGADALRERQVGDRVRYVVNRNINFTNVCMKNCKFCAFARGIRSEQAYFLPTDEIVRRALQAQAFGATEVCLQAGLAPTITADTYIEVCDAVHSAAPELHIHAFSPEEIKFGAALARCSAREFLTELRAVGLGTLPGTSAEILDDELRDAIAPQRISTSEWQSVIRTAHELGIRTTSTIMYGHRETIAQRVAHMDMLRSIQRETGGFTEFVPLSFVHDESPLFLRQSDGRVQPGPTRDDTARLFAISRLMLGDDIPNLQVSWVKLGLEQSQELLRCGANDLGGTLMNESISTSAGATHGQLVTPSRLRATVRHANRMPVERTTLYGTVREFSRDGSDDPVDPLDSVVDIDAEFGSYAQLTRDPRFRYEPRRERLKNENAGLSLNQSND